MVSVEKCDHPLKEDASSSGTPNEKEEERSEEVKEKSNEREEAVNGSDSEGDGDEDRSNEREEITLLTEKVSTLSSTLQTVMEQKSIMEANYQADKKKMMVSIRYSIKSSINDFPVFKSTF